MSGAPKYAEVFAELEALLATSKDGPDGFTISDLAAHLGLCHRGAAYKVREWADAGLVQFVGKRRVTNITGGVSVIPVYRPYPRKG